MVTMKTTGRLLLLILLGIYSGSAFSQQTIENNRICLDPIAGRGVYAGTTPGGGVCLLCGTADASLIVDGDLSNYAVASLPVGVINNTILVIVKDSLQYYPGGNEVGFVIGPNSGLLSAAVLSNLRIETYRSGTLVQSAVFGSGSPLLSLSVLQTASNGKQIISFTTGAGQNFDEVRLVGNGTVAAATSLRIYEAFEGPANCAHDCANALTSSEVSSITLDAVGGLGCIGTNTSASGNINDADTTNFATINFTASLGCARSIQVNTPTLYPAGTFAGFVMQEGSTLLGLSLLGGVSITTLNSGAVQQTISGSSLISAMALQGSSPTYQVGFKTNLPFNQIRITISGVTLLTTYNIFYAFVKLDTDNDGVPDCMDKCSSGNDLSDTDGDGTPDGCDTNAIDLSLAKSANNSTPAKGASVTFTITATRDNTTQNATGVKITDILPAGLTYLSHTAPTGTFYTPGTGVWTVGSALGGTTNTLSLTINARVDTVGVVSNIAQITASNETDTDNASVQDHIASACVTVPVEICQGQSITLIAPTAGSYQWYRDDVLIAGATDDSLVVTLSGNYTVNFTSSSGCLSGNCCPIIIDVNALPSISAGTNVTACAGTTTTLTATGTGTLVWNTGATTSSISVSPTLTTNYTVTITSTEGCSNADTVTVTANPAPLSANALAICNNAGTTSNSADDTFTITLNPSGGSGSTYQVSLNGSSVSGTFNYGSPSVAIPAGLISSGSRTLLITDGTNGCALSTIVSPPASCSSCPPKVCVPITIVRSE